MASLKSLLSLGFFAAELPPCFTSESFGSAAASAQTTVINQFLEGKKSTKCVVHNLARTGTLRRKLGIPNPYSFFRLSHFVASEWKDLFKDATRSNLSLSKPTLKTGDRAIQRLSRLSDRPFHRARIKTTARYLLQTDISRFYPSIYTHTIPWAIHSRATAKANYSEKLRGNKLDRLCRELQDNQTIGIPIGPDTSLLVAEILLSAVDAKLEGHFGRPLRGFRYIDDYEIAFGTLSEAEAGLGALQEVVNEFELALNPLKTSIRELPVANDNQAIAELRAFIFRTRQTDQIFDLMRYFDRAFELSKIYRDKHILKYAVARIKGIKVHSKNWSFVQHVILHAATVESGCISAVLDILIKYRDIDYDLELEQIRSAFDHIIQLHAPLGHGSETVWALWSALKLNFTLELASANAAARMDDALVSVILLDARQNSLTPVSTDFSLIESKLLEKSLSDENWILAYEAVVHGWMLPSNGFDYISKDPFFSFLRANNVSFYLNESNLLSDLIDGEELEGDNESDDEVY